MYESSNSPPYRIRKYLNKAYFLIFVATNGILVWTGRTEERHKPGLNDSAYLSAKTRSGRTNGKSAEPM